MQTTEGHLKYQQYASQHSRPKHARLAPEAAPGQQGQEHNLDTRQAAQQPMGELHPCPGQTWRDHPAVAEGPVGAAQAIARDAHNAAHGDQQDRRDQR